MHEAILAHHVTAEFALDLRPGDVYWCTADPGWVTGTSYGILGPLSCGVTVVTDSADFDARRWYRILQDEGVTVFYTAPTALRMLMRAGADLAHEFTFPALRHVVSVGEPLNPEAVVWGVEAFGMPVHDTWWQTETGAIMVSNFPGMPVRPGSMGRPVPGVDVAVLAQGADGRAEVRDGHVRVLDRPRRGRRAGAAARVAVDVPRLPRRPRPLCAGLRRRVVPQAETSPASTPTATSGSSVAPTTSSSRRGTSSGPSRSRAP